MSRQGAGGRKDNGKGRGRGGEMKRLHSTLYITHSTIRVKWKAAGGRGRGKGGETEHTTNQSSL